MNGLKMIAAVGLVMVAGSAWGQVDTIHSSNDSLDIKRTDTNAASLAQRGNNDTLIFQSLKEHSVISQISVVQNGSWFWEGLIGVFGVLVGSLLTYYLGYRQDKNRKDARYSSLLLILKEETKHNLDLECQIHAYLYARLIPSFDLDLYFGNNLLLEFTNICIKQDVLKNLFRNYFEYTHIQQRLSSFRMPPHSSLGILEVLPVESGEALSEVLTNDILGGAELVRRNIRRTLNFYNFIIDELHSIGIKGIRLTESYLTEMYEESQQIPDVINSATYQGIDLNDRPAY